MGGGVGKGGGVVMRVSPPEGLNRSFSSKNMQEAGGEGWGTEFSLHDKKTEDQNGHLLFLVICAFAGGG